MKTQAESSTNTEAPNETITLLHKTVEGLTSRTLPEIRNIIALLDTVKPCKQFQLALMDLDAMAENLASINEDGFLPRLQEIPLEASILPEETIPGYEADLIYNETEHTESGHEVATEGSPV